MRKLTLVLVSLVYVISLLSVAAFAAETKQSTPGAKKAKVAYTDIQLEQMRAENPQAKKPATSAHTSLGFLSSPGIQIGTTSYDIQHNSAMGRQIAVGTDSRVHAVWTGKDVAVSTRTTRYTSINPPYGIGNVSDPGGAEVSDAREGHMCNVDVIVNLALPVWRYGGGFAAYRSTSALENFVGTGSFTTVDLPTTGATCEGIFAGATAEPYIWPKVAGDRDGSLNPVAHVVAMEGNSGADMSGIAYYKGTGGTFTTYGTCGRWIDSTQAISYSIAQDPNSDKVIIAYQKSRDADDGSRDNGDAAYRMSLDNGNTWGAVVNITNYPTAGKERAVQETSCLFTADGCAHVVFIATTYDTTSTPEDYIAKLYHYDDCKDCISLVLDANNEDTDCNMKAFERAISRVSISECYDGPDTNLYVVYTRYLGDNNPATAQGPDCSDNGHPNGEIFAQASSDSKKGETWGPPVNLTNTPDNGCLAGDCDDDNFSTTAKYSTGSLHIEYMNDKDAGSFIGNESASSDETANPIMYLNTACFDMADNYALSATPAGLLYPTLHAAPGGSDQDTVTLTNAGNVDANWTRTISYGVGSGWLTVAASGSVTSGCANSAQLLITASAAALSEGYYTATITFNYGISSSFQFPVEFHVWNNFFLPQYIGIRTSLARLAVSQPGRIAGQSQNNMFYFFSDQSEPFYDASLVLGNSAANLSWLIFAGQVPSVNNPFGPLYAQSNLTYDSTTYVDVPNTRGYRFATGRGSNRDSTLSYIVNYYAPFHPDTSKSFIATFKLFKGPKNAGGSVTGLTVAFANDMDVKDDSSENRGGSDVARQGMWQRGVYAANANRYAGIRAFRRDNVAISGGFVTENDQQIYPLAGWENDSMWNRLAATTGYTFPDSSEDLNTTLVIYKNATVNGATNDTLRFGVVWAATESGGVAGLQTAWDRGKQFLCTTGREYNGTPVCAACKCGDADNNGAWSIADAVYLINYIFAGGNPPGFPGPLQVCLGDADGNKAISIADAVWLINYIFAGGAPPGGC